MRLSGLGLVPVVLCLSFTEDLSPLTGGLHIRVVHPGGYMSEFYRCYAEYLERMLDETDDLACVAEETVTEEANVAVLEEWAYLA